MSREGRSVRVTDTVRVWLVERAVDSRNLVTLTYATPDGERQLRRQQSASVMAGGGMEATAARDVPPDELAPVAGVDRERYAAEAARMADAHEPDDRV
jgi:hypothetical protein